MARAGHAAAPGQVPSARRRFGDINNNNDNNDNNDDDNNHIVVIIITINMNINSNKC